LKSTKREEDVAARYGGDEFCTILPHTSIEQANIVAHRLIENFNKQIGDFKVTMSIGIASTDSQGVTDAESLVKAADVGMYRSKKIKGHAVTLADSD
jgi:diguanylate cyclase (GGDEF)-like protein